MVRGHGWAADPLTAGRAAVTPINPHKAGDLKRFMDEGPA